VNRLCLITVGVFGLLYIVALFLLAVGTFGLFGQERDPLAVLFLIPLGVPWNLLLSDFSEAIKPWLATAAPAINLVILLWVCRKFSRAS